MNLNKNKKYYFLVSDIHSFADELKSALFKAGFRKTNKNHTLVVLGDLFDRGPKTMQVYEYIKSLPKSRRILIKGNHEELYFTLLTKSFPERNDFHNMTVNTFCDIACMPIDVLNEDTYNYDYSTYFKGSRAAWETIKHQVKYSKITTFLKSSEWKNFYEIKTKTKTYICVHSFIPVKPKQEYIAKLGICAYTTENPYKLEYDPEWRDSKAWSSAIWYCP